MGFLAIRRFRMKRIMQSRITASLTKSNLIIHRLVVPFVTLLSAAIAFGQAAPPAAAFRPDRILIKPKPGRAPAGLANLHAALGTRVLRRFAAIEDIHVLKLPGGLSALQAIASYQQSGLVEFAEPDYWVHLATVPNDPYYASGALWHLNNTGQKIGRAHV